MVPELKDKRESSGFVPYKITAGSICFFLQKRTIDAPLAPGRVGMFGGGLESGEVPEVAMFRETEEELMYIPSRAVYFSRYESAGDICHVFLEEVADDFEENITVCEGDYGKFFSLKETQTLPEVVPLVRLVTVQLAETLNISADGQEI